MTVPHSRTLLAAAFLLMGSRFGLTQSTPAQLPAAELVRSVIHNELHPPANSEVRWKYRVEKESDGKHETRAVIETKDGSLYRLLAVARRWIVRPLRARILAPFPQVIAGLGGPAAFSLTAPAASGESRVARVRDASASRFCDAVGAACEIRAIWTIRMYIRPLSGRADNPRGDDGIHAPL